MSGLAGFAPEPSRRWTWRTLGRSGAQSTRLDLWPRTGRILPWSLALFLVMIYLVPFDQVYLPIHLPVNSTPDRFLLPVMATVWVLAALAGTGNGRPVLRRSGLLKALVVFMAVIAVSIIVNISGLSQRQELSVAIKQSSLYYSYVAFFFIAVTVLRAEELRSFSTLIIGLATICAACVTFEYLSGFNVLYWLANHILPSTVPVTPPPLVTSGGRRAAVGPAATGLATALMLALALPFALMRLGEVRGPRRILFAAIAALLVVGALATLKKTAIVLPIITILTLSFYRPRTLPWTTLLCVGLVLITILAVPSVSSSFTHQLSSSQLLNSSSSESRTNTLAVEKVDLITHPFFGRGSGTFLPQTYLYTDDQYLLTTIETGFIGLIALLLVIVTAALTAHRCHRLERRCPRARIPWGPVGIPSLAGVLSFAAASALFDVLSFPQDPYLFLFVGAMAVVSKHTLSTGS